jgi:hypothetical protein
MPGKDPMDDRKCERDVDELAVEAFDAIHDTALYLLKISSDSKLTEPLESILSTARYWSDMRPPALCKIIKEELAS